MGYIRKWFGWIPAKAWIVLVVACLLGVGLAIGTFFAVRTTETDMNTQMFKDSANQAALVIGIFMQKNVDLLKSLATFYTFTNSTPDYRAFSAFVGNFQGWDQQIISVQYIPMVPFSRRASTEASNDMMPGEYMFTSMDANGNVAMAGPANDYLPVYYLVPMADNELMVGLDMFSVPDRRAAIQRAMSLNTTTTAPVYLYEKHKTIGTGILIATPIHNPTTKAVTGVMTMLVSVDWLAEYVYMSHMSTMSSHSSTMAFAYTIYSDVDSVYTPIAWSDGDMHNMPPWLAPMTMDVVAAVGTGHHTHSAVTMGSISTTGGMDHMAMNSDSSTTTGGMDHMAMNSNSTTSTTSGGMDHMAMNSDSSTSTTTGGMDNMAMNSDSTASTSTTMDNMAMNSDSTASTSTTSTTMDNMAMNSDSTTSATMDMGPTMGRNVVGVRRQRAVYTNATQKEARPPPSDPADITGAIRQETKLIIVSETWIMVSTNEGQYGTWVPWVMLAIILFLTIALLAYLVYSLWGYRTAIAAAHDESGAHGAASNNTVGNGLDDDNI